MRIAIEQYIQPIIPRAILNFEIAITSSLVPLYNEFGELYSHTTVENIVINAHVIDQYGNDLGIQTSPSIVDLISRALITTNETTTVLNFLRTMRGRIEDYILPFYLMSPLTVSSIVIVDNPAFLQTFALSIDDIQLSTIVDNPTIAQ